MISLGIGVIAAIIGLGGGFLFVPTLTLIFGTDPKTAIGTSLAIMVFSSFSASLWYRKQGMILFKVALILIIPSMLASVAGSYLTTLVDAWVLVALFCIMLILISVEMLFPGFRFLKEIHYGPSFALAADTRPGCTRPVARIRYSHLFF